MKDWRAIRNRYLQDELPIRLGCIASNLGRVESFAPHHANHEAVASLIEESKFFIEWTAGEADINTAAELVKLQIQLAIWQLKWDLIWEDRAEREKLSQASGGWSQRVLQLSGLLE